MNNLTPSKNGRELLLCALRCQPVERTPWVPFVGVHGGALIGVDATAHLQSADHIFRGLREAAKRYRPDGLPVAFDLQLEAEVLGCALAWAKETPPSVASHPLGADYATQKLPTFSVDQGRIPFVLEATRRAKAAFGEEIALYGVITGPLTLALHLRGDDLLLDMFEETDEVPELLAYCTEIARQMAEAYLEAGADVIAVVDPMVSQIGPHHFEEFVAPCLNRIFDHVRDCGGLSSLFVCGNATRNLEAMCATQCDNISIDENVNLADLARVAQAHGKSFGGNLKLTVVLLLGDEDDTRRDVVRALDQAGTAPGFVLAPGCDLPYAVKTANLETVAALVHDPYQVEVARRLPAKDLDDDFADIAIPEYGAEKSVIVDVVTLDSAGCAPCAYIYSAAMEAARAFEGPVSVHERKITGREGLAYMKKLGVSAIPSICVDGQERFASIIPDRRELIQALSDAATAKGTGRASP
ncbi:MAG: uroporphyrinogen decarboxylase family protein [Opitutales bacterium]|nr:uroporphyrinogen decarboxylase family protein [Opitutales bacterium]